MGITGILAFALVPYAVLLGFSQTLRRHIAGGSRDMAYIVLIVYLVLAFAFRMSLWALVPDEDLTLSSTANWTMLIAVAAICCGAELKATGVLDMLKARRPD